MNAKTVVRKYWELMQTNDFHKASEMLSEDYVCHWPQSGEVIRGRENFVLINANYPAQGQWRFTLNHILCEGEQVVTDVSVTDGVISGRALTFSTVRDGLIVKQVEYWPDDFAPQDWRKEWVDIVN
ncbi:nuclear transport factor 2 family protein [Hahella aquimaris]|uniref:nuclear transport factor 2 family protein n=1 Tax=Hahella sp. HNIBRBA332 TaxID=3015983 RepID=UPI00273BCA20|nr:nuclear transport factor 2 family protein [Hahella sp. HNIBRBA332]WLQ12320.1 nuclear transport factor 2 family protein [Hahella sp. HNIBRBA332]